MKKRDLKKYYAGITKAELASAAKIMLYGSSSVKYGTQKPLLTLKYVA